MKTDSKIIELISTVSEKNIFQKKALYELTDKLSQEEKDGLNSLINFYVKQGDTVDHLADCYLEFIQNTMEEQRYFIENRHYRYSSSSEVNLFFYQNPDYMEYYMKGLAISQYLIEQHRNCRGWFCDKISALTTGGNWLEVGVGHGEYFTLTLLRTNFEHYLGIDISPTSVLLTNEMVKQRIPAGLKSVEVREQDFFQYNGPVCDAVIMGEILEHVDRPAAFLEKVYEITNEKSFIYITTVINAPAIDHVFLFSSVEEIEELYQNAGFEICDKLLCPSHGYTVEKALKRKAAIITAHVLKKEGTPEIS